ncbi:MAG: hypothetical protein M0Q91_17455, partial [Methanoregula sp.]|nr:hypothetical protein [Methanoregula sp.]
LTQEVLTKYEHGAEGYYVFTTQVVDSTLSRMYPYLVNYAKENYLKIQAGRTEELIDGVQQVVVYTLGVTPAGEEEPEEGEEETPLAPDNPYPLSPEIDPSTVPIEPGTPVDVTPPDFPGTPYDPKHPTRRERSPYVPRTDEPDIPWLPGGWTNPDSPIQRGDPVEVQDRLDRLIDTLPRAGEVEISFPSTSEPGEGEPSEEEPSENEPEEGEPTEEQPDESTADIEALLQRILDEIIRQGALTRQTILDTVGSLQQTVASVEIGITDTLAAVALWLGDIITNAATEQTVVLTDIKELISDAQSQTDDIIEEDKGIIGEAIETASEFLGDAVDTIGSLISGTLEGIISVLETIESTIAAGLAALGEGIIDSITGFYDIYFQAQEALLKFITDGLTLEPEDINKYLCQFLSAVSNIKNECSWLNTRSD